MSMENKFMSDPLSQTVESQEGQIDAYGELEKDLLNYIANIKSLKEENLEVLENKLSIFYSEIKEAVTFKDKSDLGAKLKILKDLSDGLFELSSDENNQLSSKASLIRTSLQEKIAQVLNQSKDFYQPSSI